MALLLAQLEAVLAERQLRWATASIATPPPPAELEPQLLGLLSTHAEALRAAWLDEAAVSRLSAATLLWLRQKNQFFQANDDAVAGCEALHQVQLEALREALTGNAASLERALRGYRRAVGDFVISQLAGATAVVCSEYSPALQLEVLHLTANSLRGPVLDLGCGKHGKLVQHLRAAGLDAHGVDLDAAAPFTQAQSWLECELAPKSWGSIVSHQALSLHLLRAHLRGEPLAEALTRRVLVVLEALREGGRFVYAPGLPFLEQALPASRYRVERFPLTAVMAAPLEPHGAGHATHLTRR
jgi:hypothetical protein